MPFESKPVINYTHEQQVASSSWGINHSLNTFPIVDVFVNQQSGLIKIIPEDVTYIDSMTCIVSFTQPTTGIAKVM